MMGRHERRADLARYRRDASRRDLLTFLVEPDDGLLATAPFLQRAARHWLDALSTTRSRSCIVCSSWLWSAESVGALLISTPAVSKPTSAGTAAVCRGCWDDLPLKALERAVEQTLQSVIPGGRLEPMDTRR
jgi:hypothetical protein